MNVRRLLVGLLVSTILLAATSTRAESAAEAFARGKALLAKGDLQDALKSYAVAARGDRANREYLNQYMIVRQAMEMQKRLDVERNRPRWEKLARSLHHFYGSQGIYSEMLALDRRIHSRLQTASSAVMLAETELAMGRNTEAAETLSSLAPEKTTAASQALLGIALARQGKLQQARRIAETVILSEKAGPGTTYSVARLQAAVGNSTRALRLLTRCFESVAPSRLAGFKTHAKRASEFAGLASTAEFAAVLQVKSKVPESKCSGGSKCAGCPTRGKCGKASGQGP